MDMRLYFLALLSLICFKTSFAQGINKEVLPNDTTIYSKYIVDQPAYLSSQELNKHAQENLKYPADAFLKGIEGTFYVQFVVEKDGSITNVKVSKGVDEELDKEAVRVISIMPRWKPGKINGVVVRTKNETPVKFKKLN